MSALEPEDFNELFDRKELQEVHLAKVSTRKNKMIDASAYFGYQGWFEV
jgi:hypothetical protein